MSERSRREHRVYACLLHRDQEKPLYLPVSASTGVIAPGERVEVRIKDVWLPGTVVEGWEHQFGSVVCVELLQTD